MWDLPGPGIEPVSPALAGGSVPLLPQADRPHISTCLPPYPHQLRSIFCLEVLLPPIGASLDSPDSVDGIGGWGADTGFRL